MVKLNRTNILTVGLALILMTIGVMVTQARAQDVSGPEQVVTEYLAGLVNGDTQTLSALIDGRMKRKNRALELSPETYSTFLKKHYAGVQTTLEEITQQGDRMHARVRFDYPTSDTSMIELVVEDINGQWKIIDEVY